MNKTTEALKLSEGALEDIVRVFKFETGTPVEALAAIREARAQEQAEQDPVGYFAYDEEHDIWEELVRSSVAGGVPLYREPVQQVDLTDAEVEAIMVEQGDLRTTAFARAVIAAYKEKNK